FIEHHSHDVSRGGIFIKTPSPFPSGTLLKFELKIAEEQKVMQGVGRVVWKREAGDSGSDSPSGMGVKFIKIDGDSKGVIDRLVDAQTGTNQYDAGSDGGGSAAPAVKPAAAASSTSSSSQAAAGKPTGGPVRKATMIGLG